MRKTPSLVSAALALAALAGCAHKPPGPPLELRADGHGDGCRFEAEGRALESGNLGESERLLAGAARAWRRRPVTVLADVNVPYKCFGLAIYTLQRAGVSKVGFISEPPPGPD